jgi:hypothetical protein
MSNEYLGGIPTLATPQRQTSVNKDPMMLRFDRNHYEVFETLVYIILFYLFVALERNAFVERIV